MENGMLAGMSVEESCIDNLLDCYHGKRDAYLRFIDFGI